MTKSVLFFLAALATFSAISCGTRKTDISYQKQFKDSITIENHYTQATKTVLMDVFTAKPFDTLKPMVINGKNYWIKGYDKKLATAEIKHRIIC